MEGFDSNTKPQEARASIRGWMRLCCHRRKTRRLWAQCQEQDYQLGKWNILSLKWKPFVYTLAWKTTCREQIPAEISVGEWTGEEDSGKELKLPKLSVCVFSAILNACPLLGIGAMFSGGVYVTVCVCSPMRFEADKSCLFLSLYNPLECQHDDKPTRTLLHVSASESQGKHIGHLC